MSILSFLRVTVRRASLRNSLACIAAGLLMLSINPPAQAQSNAQPRARGLAFGRFVISPRLRLGFGYNTNIGMNNKDEAHKASMVGLVTPSLRLSLRDTGMVRFEAHGAVTWRQYLDDNVGGTKASGLGANGGLSLTLNGAGAVAFELKDDVRQSRDAVYQPDMNDDPYQLSFTDYAADLGPGRVLVNAASAALLFHPGGDGEDTMGFTGSLTARHNYTHYQQTGGRYDNQRISGDLKLGWRFLPRSVLYASVRAGRTFYKDSVGSALTVQRFALDPSYLRQATRNNDSTSLWAGLGLRTKILPRFAVSTRVGYSTGFYDEGPNPGTISFQVQGDSNIAEGMSLRFGYATNYSDTVFANYLIYHKLYASYRLHRRFINFKLSAFAQSNKYAPVDRTLVMPGGGAIEYYSTDDCKASSTTDCTIRRHDWPIGGSAELSANAGDHVVIGVNYSVLANRSNFDASPTPAGDDAGWRGGKKLTGNPQFIRHRVYLFVALAL